MPEKIVEALLGGSVALFAFFSRRTLQNYDRRIRDTELKQEEILKALIKIDKEVVKISTTIELMRN